jgi:hypothetical protein
MAGLVGNIALTEAAPVRRCLRLEEPEAAPPSGERVCLYCEGQRFESPQLHHAARKPLVNKGSRKSTA